MHFVEKVNEPKYVDLGNSIKSINVSFMTAGLTDPLEVYPYGKYGGTMEIYNQDLPALVMKKRDIIGSISGYDFKMENFYITSIYDNWTQDNYLTVEFEADKAIWSKK